MTFRSFWPSRRKSTSMVTMKHRDHLRVLSLLMSKGDPGVAICEEKRDG